MPPVHLVSDSEKGDAPPAVAAVTPSPWRAWGYLLAGAVLLAVIGTWLVWFSASLTRKFHEEDIRAACKRVDAGNGGPVCRYGGDPTGRCAAVRRNLAGIGCLLALLLCLLPVWSPARAQEPEPAKRLKVELGLGTWISVGDSRWSHNASSQSPLGNPTSRLTYADHSTNIVEFTAKVSVGPRWFWPVEYRRRAHRRRSPDRR
jgi:hypothetical protein